MNLKATTLLLLLTIGSFTACKKDKAAEPEPDLGPEFVQLSDHIKKYRNGVVEVSKYPIDMTRKNSLKLDYYSFDENKFLTADKATSKEWHIVFRGFNSPFNTNAGSVANSPWTGNGSDVRVSGILKKFDDVSTVNAGELNFAAPLSTGVLAYMYSEVPYAQASGYWAKELYDELGEFTHLDIDPNRTFIIKLNDGRYVKFQYINMYKDDVGKITAASEKGFLSFRYFVAKSGSTDIKTK
ncbi:HmuY family protein [Pedobacter frigoris]|uniref:HmuY family protein n=1 Tax=Pedobacter frigoris TaxID=2571272 RepID=UPI00292EC482|nr:HmuY family protein [Pedobacter frigoris]